MNYENRVQQELRPLLGRMPKLDLKNNLALIKSFSFPPREGSPMVMTENRVI